MVAVSNSYMRSACKSVSWLHLGDVGSQAPLLGGASRGGASRGGASWGGASWGGASWGGQGQQVGVHPSLSREPGGLETVGAPVGVQPQAGHDRRRWSQNSDRKRVRPFRDRPVPQYLPVTARMEAELWRPTASVTTVTV